MRMATPCNMVLTSTSMFPLRRLESHKCDRHRALLDAERPKTYLDKRLAVFSTHLVSNKNRHAERGVSCSQVHIRIEEVRCDSVFLVHSCFPNDTPVR